jgi:hypothetical protein
MGIKNKIYNLYLRDRNLMTKEIVKRKKKIIAICVVMILFVAGTVAIFSMGVLIFNGWNARIDLPDAETVTQIKMERKYDWGSYSGGVVIDNKNEINEIISALYEARKPVIISFLYWSRTANETPSNRTHLSISFGGGPIFVYVQGSVGYVYVPYGWLYQVNRSAVENLIILYENHDPEWRTE